jgi:transposase
MILAIILRFRFTQVHHSLIARAFGHLNEFSGISKSGLISFTLSAGWRPADLSRALSVDLRVRVLAAVSDGLTHRQAGEWCGVGAASVSRWRKLEREQGNPKPKALGCDQRSGRSHPDCRDCLNLIVAPQHDPPLPQAPQDQAQNKTAHACKQDRPDILTRREQWFEDQLDLDPERLVFFDETWASTHMARRYGGCRRGEQLRVGIPHRHWKTTTFVGALTTRGFIAPWVLDGPNNRDAFETYIGKVLAPELRHGDVVIMDNLYSHKGVRVRETVEAAGAELRYLPRYSPDVNPIEMASSKLKALLP